MIEDSFNIYKKSFKLAFCNYKNIHLEDCLEEVAYDYCIPSYNRDIFGKILYYYRNNKNIKAIHNAIDRLIKDHNIVETLDNLVSRIILA